jgi:hypothetical protein
MELKKEATDKLSGNTGNTVLVDDITVLRRLKKHVASCDHCREALATEEGTSDND